MRSELLIALIAALCAWFAPTAGALTRAQATPAPHYDEAVAVLVVVLGDGITLDTFEGDQEDPLSLHKYLYCAANPVNLSDPNGHDGTEVEQLGTVGIMDTLATRVGYVVLKAMNVAAKIPNVTKVVIGTQTLLTWWGIANDPEQAALYYESGGIAADIAFLRSIGSDIKGIVALYKGVNELKQARGAVAILTRSSIQGGSKALSSIEPPGFSSFPVNNRARGHLLANVLGGEGDLPENLVAMYQSANLRMKNYEMQVKRAVQAGQKIEYVVTPIYGANPYPDAVHIYANGNKGFNLDVIINNVQ